MSYGDEPERDWDAERDAAVAVKRSRRDQELAARDRPPVETALDRADEAAARIAELTEEVFRRFAPVLGPDRPEPAMGEVRQSGDTSALAERLADLGTRLGGSADALARLLRRCEL